MYYINTNATTRFDDDVAARIAQFIENQLLPAGQTEMAHLLVEQLRKKVASLIFSLFCPSILNYALLRRKRELPKQQLSKKFPRT